MVQNCYATGNVSGRSSRFIGGVAGSNTNYDNSSTPRGTVQNCYATGSVSNSGSIISTNDGFGGVVGYNEGWNAVRNCVALNPSVITNNNNSSIGRVAGRNHDIMANNYARDDMTTMYGSIFIYEPTANRNGKDGAHVTNSAIGELLGRPRYNVQSFWSSTMGWDFTNVWQWGSNSRPILRNMPTGTQ